ncbi:MAG: desulfoferrodoxin [Candidatus Aenigmarchaeota archaeon]|nr:desulfoferrodoxin [Candidatus Aenigmarchaeota archaeon]
MKIYSKKDELDSALKEKHVPVIKVPERTEPGKDFEVIINVGENVPHPNTVEHHIKWIQVFAEVEDRAYNPVHVATFDLGPTFAEPKVKFKMKLEKPAILIVLGYCNLHGIWESSVKIEVE